jgi:hypothetical protein
MLDIVLGVVALIEFGTIVILLTNSKTYTAAEADIATAKTDAATLEAGIEAAAKPKAAPTAAAPAAA